MKAPAIFTVRNIGKTLVTRTQGKSKFCYSLSAYTTTPKPSMVYFVKSLGEHACAVSFADVM